MSGQKTHTLAEQLVALEVGEPKTWGNVAVAPLSVSVRTKSRYLTLGEALEAGLVAITEVNGGRSVSELRVGNDADVPVLLVDGEELVGAKQNRVLNASILVGKHSELIVPVSCTEHGRWWYTSQQFADSGVVAARNVRLRKNLSVAASLAGSRTYESDQAGVWAEIDTLTHSKGVRTSTQAMRDVFTERERELGESLGAFAPEAGQNGLLVLVDGWPVGFDVVSDAARYATLHDKFVKSYVLGARRTANATRPTKKRAERFVERALVIAGERFKSPGLGWDWRYRYGDIAGSGLVHRGSAVHATFFAVGLEDMDRTREWAMMSSAMRRWFRRM